MLSTRFTLYGIIISEDMNMMKYLLLRVDGMAKSIYLDKGMQPDELMLAMSLGEQKPNWEEIIRHTEEIYTGFSQEWKYYGKAWGWSLVLKSKAKTLCYLTPAEGRFQASFIFNDKGRTLAAGAGFSEEIAQRIEAAKDHPKNIPYDFEVTQASDVEVAKKLIAIRAKT